MDTKRVGRNATGCAALILAVVQLGYQASAQDAGPEWQSRTAEQSRIVFVAPGLEDQRARYLHSAAENHSYTIEVALWSGTAAHHAKALVQFVETSPGRHFRTRRDPRRFVEGFPAFKDKDLEFQGLKRNGNRLGSIQSRRFGFDNVECLGFAQYWGQSASDMESVGTNLLYGYYCADPGQPLSDELRKAVIAGLGIKGIAVPVIKDRAEPVIKGKAEPESRRALPLEVWLERPGRAKGLYFGKLFSMDGTGEGDLELRLPAPYGRCKGRWKFRIGADETASLIELDWKVDCANGEKAAGDYKISDSGRGEGEGRMTDGARLALEFGS